jgi:thymidylate synthase
MNHLDRQYQQLLQDIIDNGVQKGDRTGTGTVSVFGRQIRHKMSDGFPLLTTKKMAWKSVVTELLWFLRGDTNIKFLHDNNCHIWDGDYIKSGRTDGELGPIYGKQWRNWGAGVLENKYGYGNIDQITNLINDLKINPDSRRLMVSAWNVGELDQMILPPCHYGFQVYTRELSFEERLEWWNKDIESGNYRSLIYTEEELNENNVPKRAISLMWNQRSVDTFLGLPFNIASYGLLLKIIANEVNMVPDELIGNLGDVHLYSNHIEQAKEQISREPFELPSIVYLDEYVYMNDSELVGEILFDKKIEAFRPDFFKLENYQSHPAIKAPLSN